ncbi:extracellular solute-binding protein [Mucilaginibacter terrae]|uniref:extracellular solute-binding protein n=1 Tax=Mucilaginibacter terrae TaxID=1955052 RepID=UPI003627123F
MTTQVKTKFKIALREFSPFEVTVKKIWDQYCRKTGCKQELEIHALPLHDLYDRLIKNQELSTEEWDLAILNTDWITEAHAKGLVTDLTSYIDQDPPEGFPEGWPPSLLGMQQFEHQISGLPFHDGPECLIYRKDLFEDQQEQEQFFIKYGKVLQVPRNWNEFTEVAEFFHRPYRGLYGTAFAAYPDGHNTVFDFCLQLWTRGGELTDDNGRVNLNSAEAINGLLFYREMLRNKAAIHPLSPSLDSVKLGLAFASGELAMMINWFGFASMSEVHPDSLVKGKVDVADIPFGIGGHSVSFNAYWLYIIPTGSTNKLLAYDLLRYAINEENDKLLTLEGGIGCRLSTWRDTEVNAAVPFYHKLEPLHINAKSLPRQTNWADIAKIIDDMVINVIRTDREVSAIVKDAQIELDLLYPKDEYTL